MSSSAPPITPARFATALADLPLSSLHAKAAELRNSIAHLAASNHELQAFASDGDRECTEAIRENEDVIARMAVRIELLRAEVERRGFLWADGVRDINGKEAGEVDPEMTDGVGTNQGRTTAVNGTSGRARPGGGTLGDEELARRLRERMEEDDDDDEAEGLHL